VKLETGFHVDLSFRYRRCCSGPFGSNWGTRCAYSAPQYRHESLLPQRAVFHFAHVSTTSIDYTT